MCQFPACVVHLKVKFKQSVATCSVEEVSQASETAGNENRNLGKASDKLAHINYTF